MLLNRGFAEDRARCIPPRPPPDFDLFSRLLPGSVWCVRADCVRGSRNAHRAQNPGIGRCPLRGAATARDPVASTPSLDKLGTTGSPSQESRNASGFTKKVEVGRLGFPNPRSPQTGHAARNQGRKRDRTALDRRHRRSNWQNRLRRLPSHDRAHRTDKPQRLRPVCAPRDARHQDERQPSTTHRGSCRGAPLGREPEGSRAPGRFHSAAQKGH